LFGTSDASEILVKAVGKVISTYQEKTPDNKPSVQDIADTTLSGYTTINEIMRGKLKNLSVKKALEISKRLNGPTDLAELVSLVDESKKSDAESFAKGFPHLYPYEMQSTNFNLFFKDKDYARIIWAAFGNTNITREEIAYRWGEDGSNRLEILLASGLLIEKDGGIEGSTWALGGEIESAQWQFQTALNLYSPINRERQENWISIQTQCVNNQFITEFREEIRQLFIKFNEKSNSSTYRGNKRMFFGAVFDRYMSDFNNEDRGTLQ